jgi:hypothetical protein
MHYRIHGSIYIWRMRIHFFVFLLEAMMSLSLDFGHFEEAGGCDVPYDR